MLLSSLAMVPIGHGVYSGMKPPTNDEGGHETHAAGAPTSQAVLERPPIIGTYSPTLNHTALNAMEAWQGRPFDVHHVYANWDDRDEAVAWLFEDRLPQIWQRGQIPLVSWEPFTPTPDNTPRDIVSQIVAGQYDAYLDTWTTALRDAVTQDDPSGHPRRLYLRPAHEMNGDWYPWGMGNPGVSSNGFVQMWRRIYRYLESSDVPESRLQIVWSVNHHDVNATMEHLYPGDEFVDWVAVDGFNWGATREWSSWKRPEPVFGEMIQRLHSLTNKPLAITEYGTTSITNDGPRPQAKAAWLQQASAFFRSIDARLVVSFNVDKETDWAVFGGQRGDDTVTTSDGSYNVYSTYADTVPTPPQSRTDGPSVAAAEFLGQDP